jgi:hypothetical protein
VPVREIRVIEALWTEASALRRQEWRTLIADLLDGSEIAPHAERIVVALDGEAIRFTLHGESVIEDVAVSHALVGPHIDEYMTIIRRMVEDEVPAPRLEVLDMAKKVVHDRAARALAEHAPTLARGHEAFRRIFSFVVALHVDTTRLPAAHRHPRRT